MSRPRNLAAEARARLGFPEILHEMHLGVQRHIYRLTTGIDATWTKDELLDFLHSLSAELRQAVHEAEDQALAWGRTESDLQDEIEGLQAKITELEQQGKTT